MEGDGGGEKCAAIARHSGRSRNRAHCAASDWKPLTDGVNNVAEVGGEKYWI